MIEGNNYFLEDGTEVVLIKEFEVGKNKQFVVKPINSNRTSIKSKLYETLQLTPVSETKSSLIDEIAELGMKKILLESDIVKLENNKKSYSTSIAPLFNIGDKIYKIREVNYSYNSSKEFRLEDLTVNKILITFEGINRQVIYKYFSYSEEIDFSTKKYFGNRNDANVELDRLI